MGQYIDLTRKTYDLGLVTFKVVKGKALEFARLLSEKETQYAKDPDDPDKEVYVILGTRWVAAMEDDKGAETSTVIAAVRTDEGQLGAWVNGMPPKYPDYIVNPNGRPVEGFFKEGKPAQAGHDGMP